MQAIMNFLSKPFVGIIDLMATLLNFIRDKLQPPNDQAIKDMMQQTQDMLMGALSNPNLKPSDLLDQIKDIVEGTKNALTPVSTS